MAGRGDSFSETIQRIVYAYITGTLAEKKPTEAVVEAGGVGYRLLIPASSYDKLPAVGQPATLQTTFVVREGRADALRLRLGRREDGLRDAHRRLGRRPEAGPSRRSRRCRRASSATPSSRGDVAMLTRIPGVGKKVAELLVVKLRDVFAKIDGLEGASVLGGDGALGEARADARAGLEALVAGPRRGGEAASEGAQGAPPARSLPRTLSASRCARAERSG